MWCRHALAMVQNDKLQDNFNILQPIQGEANNIET